jgi:uncharacterized damage-inducible protein DinB
MHTYWQTVLARQFAAAIQMLRAALEACPDELWDERAFGTPFWHLAYHTLFYTDFYLSDDENAFQARDFHVERAIFLPGNYEQFVGAVTTPEKAFTKSQLLDYADHCRRKSYETFNRLTDTRLLERCGFPWYELNLGEFLLNNLRHLQHHTGQLILLLRRHAGIGVDWLGTSDDQPPLVTG